MRKIHNCLFLLIFLFPHVVHPADGLGRLFLSPAQRSQLETVRAHRDRRLPATADTEAAPVAHVPAFPGVVTYNGVVRRSDGASTVWLNGRPVNARDKIKIDNEVSVLGLQHDGAVAVAIPQAGRAASLRVGQSFAVSSGRIEESYSRRESGAKAADGDRNAAPAINPAAK